MPQPLLTMLRSRAWLVLLIGLVAAKSIHLTLTMGLHYGDGMGGVYSTFFFTVILILLFNLAFRLRSTHGLWIGSLLLGILLHADLLFFRYHGELLYAGMVAHAGNLLAIYESIFSLLRLSDLLLYADVPFWLAAALRWPKLPRLPRRELAAGVLVAVALFFVRYENLPPQRVVRSFLAEHYQTTDLIEMGVLHYHLQDLVSQAAAILAPAPRLSAAERQDIAVQAFRPIAGQGPWFGKFAGKNLLVIQLESFQSFVLGQRVDGQEVTPFLNRLAERSLYFPNFYPQTGSGNTSDAEILTQNAFFGLPKGVAFWTLRDNHFVSLPKLLSARGYETLSLHGNAGAFYGRVKAHQSLGFARSYFEDDLDARDRLGMGISDKAFFAQALDILENAKRPFYGFLISLSSHYPYEDPFTFDRPFQARELGLLGRYLEALHYTDEALERFFAGLEARGLLQDTVIVLYGDHNGVGRDEQAQLEKFLSQPLDALTWLELQRVPLLIHLPNRQAGMIDALGGQIDLAPTMAGLLGFQEPILFACGQDLLANPSRMLVFRDGSWIDRQHAYMVGPSGIGASAYDRSGRRPVPLQEVTSKVAEAQQQLWLSDAIMRHDLMEDLQTQATIQAPQP